MVYLVSVKVLLLPHYFVAYKNNMQVHLLFLLKPSVIHVVFGKPIVLSIELP